MRPVRVLPVIVLLLPLFASTPAQALPSKLSDNGTFDFQYGSAVEAHGGPATGYKPESKLFYTGDGAAEPVRWWGVFGTSGAQAASAGVWLWELVDHAWVSRIRLDGADVWAKADVLFDGSTAYVSLRDNGNSGVTGNPRESLLYRIPYAGNGTWGSVSGPTVITTRDMETLTIAKDSAGRLWSTFEDGRKIKVGFTSPGGTSFTYMDLPTSDVNADDISTITSFGGDRIGVAWSNQGTSRFFFAWHRDSDPVASWTIETAYGNGVGGCPTANGTRCADDHLNMVSYGDQVFIAVKTSLNDQSGTSADPLIAVLRRDSAGAWASFPVSPVSQNATRPILVLSPAENAMYVFANRSSEVDVWESAFASPSFNAASHPVWVKASKAVNNPTGTKQTTDAATGTVVLTSAGGSDTYYHNEFLPSGPPPPPNTPPVANGASASTTEDTPVAVQLSGSDLESCDLTFSIVSSPSHGSLGPISNAPCATGTPNTDAASVNYTPAPNFEGSDAFTFRVADGAAASAPATATITITGSNDPPSANDGSASTTTDTPTQIALTATDPETCELTFSIESGPSHGTLGPVVDGACSSGSPNSDSATVLYTPDTGYEGSDSFRFSASDGTLTSNLATVSISVSQAGTGIAFRSSSSGANATAFTLDIARPVGIVAGDVMVSVVDVRGTPAITPPAGWTFVRMDEIATTMRQAVYVRVVGASEPPTYTWTFSKSQTAAGAILAYSGVSTVAPVNAHSGAVNATAATTVTAPSVTTTVNGSMILGFFGITGIRSFTPPSGMAERSDLSATGTYPISSASADVLQAVAGATGDKVATASGSGKSVGQLVALRPANA